jgi:hypothetical protein
MKERHPKTLIKKSMEKSWDDYWGQEDGWKKKIEAYKEAKKKAIKEKIADFKYEINWRLTIQKTLSFSRVPVIGQTIDEEATVIQNMNRGK